MEKIFSMITVLGFFILTLAGIGMFSTECLASELPKWVSNMKFKGDVRVRYQDEERDVADSENQRFRIRLRAGIESQVNDYWSAAFGIASGGSDPRSTNQTLEDTFETGDAMLDYAYAQFENDMVTVVAGKFGNPIWNPKDLLWDGDIMPDGFAASFNFEASDIVKVFLTPTVFVLDEWKDTDTEDLPTIMALQAGIDADFKDTGYIKFAGTYYGMNGIEGNDWSEHSSGTNSLDADGNWMYDHDAFSLEAEAGLTNLPVFAALYGQYVSADVNEEDTGYLFGAKIGDKKVKELGDWQVNLNYRNLEKDAWLDFVPDSDFFGGATGVKGYEAEFTVGLSKNVSAGIDYYKTEEIDGDEEEDVIQVDLVVKF